MKMGGRFMVFLSALLFVGTMNFSCMNSGQVKLTNVDGFGLGTFYMITVKGDTMPGMRESVESVMKLASASMSVFDNSSLLSKLNFNETDSVDANIEYCINLARRVSEMSGGLYDITVLPLVEAYGLGSKRGDVFPESAINVDSLLDYVGYEKIEVRGGRLIKRNPNVRIDLNSIAKGYVVDLTAKKLEELGIEEYMVNIGGEIYCKGTNGSGRAWRTAIETPSEGNFMVLGGGIKSVVEMSDRGLATSGNYRNYREDDSGNKYTHIINPLTGENTVSSLLSATVIEDSCAYADALATMFIVMGLENAREFAERNNIAALFIYSDGTDGMKVWTSSAMKPYFVE